MRILFFLIVSSAVHLFGARWLLAVSPWARERKKNVRRVALALASLVAVLRVVSYYVDAYVLRVLMAFAMIEMVTVLFGLVFASIFLGLSRIVTRIGARVLARNRAGVRARNRARVRAAKEEEEGEEERGEGEGREGEGEGEEEAKARMVTRREAVERIAGAVAFGGTGAALGWGVVRGRHAFVLEEVVVKVPSWPKALEGYTIAQVSDVHVGPFVGDRELDEGFELVRRAKPDLVVATGDLVDADAPYVLELVKRMLKVGARDGAYGILGNHDHYAGPDEVYEIATRAGLRILNNEAIVVRGGFALVGLDDLAGRTRRADGFGGPDLAKAVATIDRELPRILLAHQPSFFGDAAGQVALQLSGHTHGGQINPGFRPADLVFKYVAGRYERNGSTLWVNRGFGTAGPPTRVGAPPEITKIVIVST